MENIKLKCNAITYWQTHNLTTVKINENSNRCSVMPSCAPVKLGIIFRQLTEIFIEIFCVDRNLHHNFVFTESIIVVVCGRFNSLLLLYNWVRSCIDSLGPYKVRESNVFTLAFVTHQIRIPEYRNTFWGYLEVANQ